MGIHELVNKLKAELEHELMFYSPTHEKVVSKSQELDKAIVELQIEEYRKYKNKPREPFVEIGGSKFEITPTTLYEYKIAAKRDPLGINYYELFLTVAEVQHHEKLDNELCENEGITKGILDDESVRFIIKNKEKLSSYKMSKLIGIGKERIDKVLNGAYMMNI